LTPTPFHTDEHMDQLAEALSVLWAECPMSIGLKYAAQ
jgi:hypothetical protein